MGAIVLVALLGLLLMAVALAFAWQERSTAPDPVITYGVEDAIEWVHSRLSAVAQGELRKSDVRRILEWEMRYLQGPQVRGDEPTVVGGINAARYAQENLWAEGRRYDGPVILEVLELQAEYLATLGAVAGVVEGDERSQVLRQSGDGADA